MRRPAVPEIEEAASPNPRDDAASDDASRRAVVRLVEADGCDRHANRAANRSRDSR
jgi:hypothetical protein